MSISTLTNCPYCGQHLLEPIDRYCTNCQRKLPESMRSPTVTQVKSFKPIGRKKMILGVGLIVFLGAFELWTTTSYLLNFPPFGQGGISRSALESNVIAGLMGIVLGSYLIYYNQRNLKKSSPTKNGTAEQKGENN